MTRLAIIDSGGANIASLQFAIQRLGIESDLTTDPARLKSASHVLLPGVGAAADCMSRLEKAAIVDTIRELQQPLLGICSERDKSHGRLGNESGCSGCAGAGV